MYLDNKYTTWYFNIINKSKTRILDGYFEIHHILPKCLGGKNNSENLVKLTAREHFICHLLLTKMTTGANKAKMVHAASSYVYWTTKKHNRNFTVNSRTIQYLKETRQQHLTYEMSKPENMKRSRDAAKALWANPEHKLKQSHLRKKLWQDMDYLNKMAARKKTVKRVIINGIIYESLKQAAISLNIDPSTVSKRCSSRHDKFANWNYI